MSLEEINKSVTRNTTFRELEDIYKRNGAYPIFHNGTVRMTNAAAELIEEAKSLPPEW